MGKVLVTGATGFIGSHVAELLVARGDELRLGVHGPGAERLESLDAEQVELDVRDRRSLRRALKGVERVFHCAGVSSVSPADSARLFEVNVGGTKAVMEECLHAGVERVVCTSSAAVVGPAPPGGTADETQLFTAGRLGIPYVNSVHEAEVEAMRVAARGLPLVCVNPALVFGAGDYNATSTRLVRSFVLGRLPVYFNGAVNVVDVLDVARGHLLADERGRLGERYMLGGRNFTFDRLFADLGRLSGVDPPLRIPGALATAAAVVLDPEGRGWPLTRAQIRMATQWWTYRSTKAHRELGWQPRPHEETLETTVAWHLDREHGRIVRTRRSRIFPVRAAAAALRASEDAAGVAARALRRVSGAAR